MNPDNNLMVFLLNFVGGKSLESDGHFSVPIHVVTQVSQLPIEFLEPSPERQLVIGFDCEGVDLCRHGTLCIMQVLRCQSFQNNFGS